MPKFRKRPVVIEATQWFENGDHPKDHAHIGEGPFSKLDLQRYANYTLKEGKVVKRYRLPEIDGQSVCRNCGHIMHVHGWIDTLEGGHIVCPGDWIITGVKGEKYPCKPDIFELTYEFVN